MASATLDFVRSVFAAWERGDFSSVDWAHPEIEFVIADGPEPGSWRGLAGMAEGFGQMVRGTEQFRTPADEYRELDDERVLVFHHVGGRGKTSGWNSGRLERRAQPSSTSVAAR
jgi:ketosteroid isomerase-like protein